MIAYFSVEAQLSRQCPLLELPESRHPNKAWVTAHSLPVSLIITNFEIRDGMYFNVAVAEDTLGPIVRHESNHATKWGPIVTIRHYYTDNAISSDHVLLIISSLHIQVSNRGFS